MGKKGNGRVASFLRFILVILWLAGFAVHTFGQDQWMTSIRCLRTVWSMALEPDGKVLVGGWFSIGAEAGVARVNATEHSIPPSGRS